MITSDWTAQVAQEGELVQVIKQAGLAQKTQPSFTHPVLYGFTQLEKPRKTGLYWVLLKNKGI